MGKRKIVLDDRFSGKGERKGEIRSRSFLLTSLGSETAKRESACHCPRVR